MANRILPFTFLILGLMVFISGIATMFTPGLFDDSCDSNIKFGISIPMCLLGAFIMSCAAYPLLEFDGLKPIMFFTAIALIISMIYNFYFMLISRAQDKKFAECGPSVMMYGVIIGSYFVIGTLILSLITLFITIIGLLVCNVNLVA